MGAARGAELRRDERVHKTRQRLTRAGVVAGWGDERRSGSGVAARRVHKTRQRLTRAGVVAGWGDERRSGSGVAARRASSQDATAFDASGRRRRVERWPALGSGAAARRASSQDATAFDASGRRGRVGRWPALGERGLRRDERVHKTRQRLTRAGVVAGWGDGRRSGSGGCGETSEFTRRDSV